MGYVKEVSEGVLAQRTNRVLDRQPKHESEILFVIGIEAISSGPANTRTMGLNRHLTGEQC